MMSGVRRRMLGVLALMALWVGAASAQEYVIGNEDVLQVSVWLHPELERTVTVSGSGSIIYPPMGEVPVAGLTLKQLGDKLGERVSSFLHQTTAVTVTVAQYNSRSVFVSGAVSKPGRYGFEHIPGLIDVISQAGGALPGADLTQVQVIHRNGEARSTITADVASALRDGVGVKLPELQAGDAVVVPGTNLPGTSAAGTGVGILGEVTRPGLYPVGISQDLWAVIAAAGGPTAKGNLQKVQVITRQGTHQVVATINLRDVLRRGARSPFMVRPGDVVFVGSTNSTARGRTWEGFQQVIAVSRDLLNIVLLRDVIRRTN
jgi:polysaccharide export outer membrane protein